MIAGSIARRYAKALLEIGVDGDNFEDFGKELDAVAAQVAASRELKSALENPVFPQSQRRAILEAVAKKMKVSATLRNFLMVLVDANRISALGDIARESRALVDEQANRVRAVVTSVKALPATVESRIKSALEARTGKTVLLEKREDPSLIGGIVAQIGDVVYDGSVRTQLQSLRGQLLSE